MSEQTTDEIERLHTELAQMTTARDVLAELLKEAEDESATARAEVERLRAERSNLEAAFREQGDALMECLNDHKAQQRRASTAEAERDRLAEQVKRAREELRKSAAYLVRRADLDADLSPSESRALAHDLRDAALDGTEAGS